MQDEGDTGSGNVSIGEEDQLRDQEMIRELQDEDGQQDDKLEPSRRLQWADSPRSAGKKDRKRDDWHPGDAEQPDRSTSEGLTGSGPAQPDP
jgi:hypothetical protein